MTKDFEEELDEIADSKDLNMARQKRFDLLINSLRGKSSLLKNTKLWDQSRANTLNLHFFHCQNVNPILEGCIAESVDAGTLRDIIGTSLLHVAARTNDLTAATKLVSELGADINALNMSGISPLHSALASGNSEIAEMLIKKGAELNIHSLSWRLFRVPFPGLPKDIWCCNRASTKIPTGLKRLLDCDTAVKSEDITEPPNKKFRTQTSGLHASCFDNDLEGVIESYQSGADLECRNWRQDTPLICAVRNSALDVVEWLLENNVSPERGGWCYETPLIAATTENNVDAVQLLLDEDADMDSQDENGWSSVLIAAKCGYKLLTANYIEGGADVSITSRNGESVLYWVARHGWGDLYKRLTQTYSLKMLSDAIACSKLYNDETLPVLLLSQNTKSDPIGKLSDIKSDTTTVATVKIANTSG